MSNLSFVNHVGDGASTQFPITVNGENIGYFRTEDIHTYVDGVEVTNTIEPASPHLVIINPAPINGAVVLIRREMPQDQTYTNFERGNNFGKRQLNNTSNQQLYLTQEILDGFKPEGYYEKQNLNAGGHRVINLAEPIEGTDAVNKQITDVISSRLSALESVLETSVGSIILVYDYISEGGESVLDIPYTLLAVHSVTINGVRQMRSTFTSDGAWELDSGVINIAEPLEKGDTISVDIVEID